MVYLHIYIGLYNIVVKKCSIWKKRKAKATYLNDRTVWDRCLTLMVFTFVFLYVVEASDTAIYVV